MDEYPVFFECLSFENLTNKQLYDAMALRQSVFAVEQDCPYLDADGKDFAAFHVLGYDTSGDLVAYTRLLPIGLAYEGYASIGRVANAQKVRGKGIGRRLMLESLNYCASIFGPQTPIKISAQLYLQRFYEEMGFIAIGNTYLEDNIPHIAMIKKPEPRSV